MASNNYNVLQYELWPTGTYWYHLLSACTVHVAVFGAVADSGFDPWGPDSDWPNFVNVAG